MKRAILFLSLAFVLQLALALGLHLADDSGETARSQGKLLTVNADDVDILIIEGEGGQSVQLTKAEGKWILPGYFDAPADSHKVEEVITTLAGMQRAWPVAQTSEAIKRFKVADEGYERRLTFKAGGKDMAVLYLGTSPGFRKVHARVGAEAQVFDILFSTYQASVKNSEWVDKQLLWVDGDAVTGVTLPHIHLTRAEGKWTLADMTDNEELNEEGARQLTGRIARLNIQDISDAHAESLPEAVLNLHVDLRDGTSRDYAFMKKDKDGHALLKVSGQPFVFKVGAATLKGLQETTRGKLVKAKEYTASSPTEQEQQPPAVKDE